MPVALRRWRDSWLYQLRGPQPAPIVLTHRRVFILPTRQGCIFFLVLLLMLAGSANYALSLGFVLTFLLAGLGLNGILYTFRNIANLQIRPGKTEPVFAGQIAQFGLLIENSGRIDRSALEAVSCSGQLQGFDLPGSSEALLPVFVQTERRGRLPIGRVVLQTRFPLGLFRAWSNIEPDQECIVFPRPEDPAAVLPIDRGEHGEGAAAAAGNEDFAGLRAYHAGDSPRRIAWKADAREQGLLSKLFTGQADAYLWFDYHELPSQMDVEARLSRLTRWILEAEAAGTAYGLRLGPLRIEPDTGADHRLRCLQSLALYDHDRPA